MSPEDLFQRLLNPAVMASMVGAGIAYGALLWALNIRPTLNLVLTAFAPGVIFLAVIWSIRTMQGVVATTYIALLADWVVFAGSAALTVLAWRWRQRPRRFP